MKRRKKNEIVLNNCKWQYLLLKYKINKINPENKWIREDQEIRRDISPVGYDLIVLSATENLVLDSGPRWPWSCDAYCIVLLQTGDHFLWNSGFDVHEGEEVMEVSVDRHNSTSYFSSVLDGGSVDVSVSSLEKLSDPGRGEIMFVDRLVLEQHYIPHLGD